MSCKSNSTDPLVETAEAQRERERRTVDSFFAAFESGTSASPSPTAKTLAALAQADLDGLLLPGKDRPRSVLWKIYFGQIPPPESHQSHDPLASEPLASSSLSVTAPDRPPLRDWLTRSVSLVREERRAYHFQKRASDLERVLRQAREALLDPHPEEEEEEEPDGEEDPDPALELLKLIEKDVERTFPEIALFAPQDAHDDDDKDDEDNVARSQLAVEEEEYRCSIRAQLTAMLYVWCTSHPDVGYRQGIHELAAACYYVRWHDRLSAWRADALHGMVCVLLDETEAEADAYALFDAIMTGMKRWYEWRNPSSARTSPTPILAKSAAIMALLNKVDPALGKHLDEVGVEPQLFALRWVRLLFTREFPLDQALLLWDGLFAYDALEASQFGTFNVIALDGGDSHCRRIRPSEDGDQGQGQAADDPDAAGGEKLGLLNAICVAMLIRIRAYTLDEDYTQVITQLLRYPRLGQIATLAPEGDVLSEASAVALLVTQAARIRTLPGTSTGALIASENRAKLGVPVSIERPVAPRAPSLRPAPEPKRGFALPEGITDLARGVYDRSESFGIQKAVGSAVANMQRTVTAYAQQAGHAGVQRHKVGSDGFPSAWEEVVPASHRARRLVQSLSGPRSLSGELPPRHSAPHRDLERLQVARERDRVMGAAMGGCIEALEAKWKSPTTTMDALTPEDMACVMAITTLKHIRDVLLAGESTYDPGMLAPWLTRAEPEPEREPAPEPVPDSAWGSDVSAAPPELASAAPDGQGASAPGSLALTTGPSHPQDPARLSAARVHSGPVRRTTHMFSSVSPSPSSVVYPIRGLNVPSRGPAQGHGPSERASSASGPLGRPGPVRPGPASVPSGQGSFGARARVPLQERLAAAASHQHQHQHQHQHRGSSEAAAASADTSTEPTGSLASSGPRLAHGAPTPLAKSSAPSSGRHGQQMAVAAEDPLGAL